jgi:hypothetical protein
MKNLLCIFVLLSLSCIISSYTEKEIPSAISKQLVFPVSGNKFNIGSFWGAERDGGRRKHEGIDIFARKGTSVVAVCDGLVVSVGNGGIGGKTVWLQSDNHPWTAYYAHLDMHKVHMGEMVKKGQVIGTVGNTGNAITTPSHLHFGIYTYSGAVNPLPYVKNSVKINAPFKIEKPIEQTMAKSKIKNKAANPEVKSTIPSSFPKQYVLKTMKLITDPAAKYYVTIRSNVVRMQNGQLQVIGKWNKSNDIKYPYNMVLTNKKKLYVNRSGKLININGQQVGSIS